MLLPIGKFARASRLSIKSLRNYDESGLLPASFIDPQSGYRYYRLEQLARADAIRSLRMVNMPLPQIAKALETDNPEELLTSHLATLEDQRDELNRKAQELQRRISLKEYVMSSQIATKSHPEIVAIGYRTETTHVDVFTDIPRGFGIVMAALEETDTDPVGPPFTMFHQPPDGDTPGDIAMCIPTATPVELGGETASVTIEPGVVASVIHRGSYDNMGQSYATVATWIQERGHSITGPTREIYLNSPADVDEADLLTELLFPIDAEQAGEVD
ncbi:MAG: MerR family transcriptional regulator [Acidimicrobiales bacterium]